LNMRIGGFCVLAQTGHLGFGLHELGLRRARHENKEE